MKKVSVLFLIAILGIALWALPAWAEKIRMTDAELDGVAAGFFFTIPPPTSIACCVNLLATGMGTVVNAPPIALATGNVSLVVGVPIGKIGGAGVNAGLTGFTQNLPPTANGSVVGDAIGPKGAVVPFVFVFP